MTNYRNNNPLKRLKEVGEKAANNKANLPKKKKKPTKVELKKEQPKKDKQNKQQQSKKQVVQQKPQKAKAPAMVKGETVKVIPLGGLEQIGLNITAFEHDDSIIVVDCGVAFPTDEMPGVDLVIPDVTYLKDNASKVKAFFITHGHEDHIGALPYILKELNVPVYGTKLTNALIEHKLEEAGLKESAKLRTVKHGDSIKAGDFTVEFVKTNHSIQDASALAIFTPAGTIFHTGDFKIDYTPIFGEPADLQRMAEIGNDGCLMLMCDSTNANHAGSTPSEKTVGKRIEAIFAENEDRRIIVASFASNVDRVQQVINAAHKFGRKVVVEGKSMTNIIDVASELGYITIPDGTLVDVDYLKNYKPEDTVIITTGSQGESMAALSRMAAGAHKRVAINEGDLVIMSSKTIPGNEKAVAKVINELYMKGADVIFHDTHVSGHACEEDIKLIYALLKPKYVLPIHGEYMHLVAQKEIAIDMGISNKNVQILSSGDVLELGENTFKVVDHVEAGPVMVDGLRVGDIGNIVLKDRQNLAQNGIIIVTLALQSGTNQLVGGPEIITRGFVYEKENEQLINNLEDVARKTAEGLLYYGDAVDINKIKTEVRDALKKYLWNDMKITPVIIPVVVMVYE